ncbi:MAG TPA: CBS domain-containing protein [Nitrospirae bacterium]|nr:CBS domain-containing protein [Nitrospirota bacterium]
MIELFADDAFEFLKSVPPFQYATEDELQKIIQSLSIELHQKDILILQQGGEPNKYLRVIKKGSVKVFIKTDEGIEIITDYRGKGDLVGYLSILTEDKARASVITLEETLFLLIPKKLIKDLIEKNTSIRDFFNSTFIKKYIDKPVREMDVKRLMSIGSDKLLFTTTTGELASKGVISTFQDVSIKESADIMSRNKVSSLVIIDNNAVPVGVVTDSDFREKVVAKGKDYNDNISSIMSINLIKSDAKEYCFEALLKMIRHNIHHLIVVDDGKIKGIITNHDLMMLQGISPINIARDIEGQYSVEGLIPVSKKTNTIISLLIKEGVKASSIAKIITELNDRLVKKIIEFAERKFGKPPVSYCGIVFGSEGRKEQTLRTDQDNAIIIEDYDSTKDEKTIKDYFTVFSEFIKTSLLKCGFPLCLANYMASNPLWRQPLNVWKKIFPRLDNKSD